MQNNNFVDFPLPARFIVTALLLYCFLLQFLGKPQKTDIYPDSVSTSGSQVISLHDETNCSNTSKKLS